MGSTARDAWMFLLAMVWYHRQNASPQLLGITNHGGLSGVIL